MWFPCEGRLIRGGHAVHIANSRWPVFWPGLSEDYRFAPFITDNKKKNGIFVSRAPNGAEVKQRMRFEGLTPSLAEHHFFTDVKSEVRILTFRRIQRFTIDGIPYGKRK